MRHASPGDEKWVHCVTYVPFHDILVPGNDIPENILPSLCFSLFKDVTSSSSTSNLLISVPSSPETPSLVRYTLNAILEDTILNNNNVSIEISEARVLRLLICGRCSGCSYSAECESGNQKDRKELVVLYRSINRSFTDTCADQVQLCLYYADRKFKCGTYHSNFMIIRR